MFWTSTSGSDSNGCTASTTPLSSTAKRTIQAGMGCLSAGDTLRIRGGTYSEGFSWINVVHGSSGARITVEATPGEAVTWAVSSGSQLALDVTSHFFTLRGIIFNGATGSNCLHHSDGVCGNPSPGANPYTTIPVSGSNMLITVGGTDNIVENCEFTAAAYGVMLLNTSAVRFTFRGNYVHQVGKIWNGNIMYLKAANTVIEGNRFIDVSAGAVGFWNADTGSQVVNDVVARQNYVERAGYFWAPTAQNGTRTDTGAQVTQGTWNTSHGAGISLSRGARGQVYNNVLVNTISPLSAGGNVSNCLIANNSVYGNPGNAFGSTWPGIGLSSDATGCAVRNNIVYQPGATTSAPIRNDGVSTSLSNNLCSSSSAGSCQSVGDPLYLAPTSSPADLRIQAASPAINNGVSLASVFTTDVLGTPRPQGAQWDIGAYEFTNPPQPDPIGLVGWWTFDGNAQDNSGLGHHGTLVGNAATSGAAIIGTNSLTLDGTGDRVTVVGTSALRPTIQWGLSAWWKMSTVGSQGCVIASNGNSLGMWIRPNGQFSCWTGNQTYVEIGGSTSVLDNVQRHGVCTYSGTVLQAYVDNSLVASANTSQTLSYTGAENFWIGDWEPNAVLPCTGLIDQVRFYDTHLAGEAVTNLFNEFVPASGMSVTQTRWTQPHTAEGVFAAALNANISVTVGHAIGLRWAIHRSDSGALTEYFRVHCRVDTGSGFGAWTEVNNSFGPLGIRFATDTAISLGQATSVLLPTEGFTGVAGKFLESPVDTTAPYDAAQRVTISQGQHAELEARLDLGSPLDGADLVQCRPQRENATAFENYANISTLTILDVAAPSNLIVGGTHQGTSWK